MNSIDVVHPEHLIDRARRGEASEDELTRLNEHLKNCTACNFEMAAARGFDRDAEALFKDSRAVHRVHFGTLKRLAIATDRRALSRVVRRRRTIGALAAVAFVIAGVGAAAVLRSGVLRTSLAAQPAVTAPVKTQEESTPSNSAMSTTPISEAPAMSAEKPPPIPNAAPTSDPKAAPRLPVGELFARANAARRSGEVTRAAQLYRELQRTYPSSSEAALSRVTLGRLLLDRLGDPNGALAQFNAYLAGTGSGSLREEGLIGRALALARLGRTTEEQAAWRALLVYNPRTTYAEHAHKRIEDSAGSPKAAH
jgi:TolA-binding protein